MKCVRRPDVHFLRTSSELLADRVQIDVTTSRGRFTAWETYIRLYFMLTWLCSCSTTDICAKSRFCKRMWSGGEPFSTVYIICIYDTA